jgi:hypothetical protein
MAGANQGIIIIVLVCCFCVVLPGVIYAILWGTNTLCDKESSEEQKLLGIDCPSVYEGSGTPDSGTPAASPLETLLASGQAIQVSEVDISAGNVAPANRNPTLPSTPTYTLSMDVFIAATATTNRNLIHNTDARPEWPATGPNAPVTRRPMIYVAGTVQAASWTGGNHICAEHLSSTNTQHGKCTSTPAPTGTYFNFMMVTDNQSKKITVYINGVNKGESTVAADVFSWSASNNWILGHPDFANVASQGALKVKNVYLFPKILTAAEMALLTGNTSTYIPQPLSMGTSAYEKEEFSSY